MAELKLGGEGYDFASDSDEYEKGCYTYDDITNLGEFRGRVYYGRGGTEEEMAAPLDGGKIRLDGADCGNSQFFIVNVERSQHEQNSEANSFMISYYLVILQWEAGASVLERPLESLMLTS